MEQQLRGQLRELHALCSEGILDATEHSPWVATRARKTWHAPTATFQD